MAAPAAAEAPVLAYIAIGILAFVSWIVLRGLASAYRATFGYLIEQLAGILRLDVWRVHWHPGDALLHLSDEFYGVLTGAAAKSEHAVGYFFHGAAVIQEWAVRELAHLAGETAEWAEWLQRVHLPKWAKWAIAAALPPLLVARLVRAAIAAELPKLAHLVRGAVHETTTVIDRRVTIPYLGDWQWLHKHWRGLQRAIAASAGAAGALSFPWVHVFPTLQSLEEKIAADRKRLHRIEALLGVTAFAGLMAKVLGLPNWRCLTRGNVGRAARAVCGIPTHLLNDLLGLIADFVILTDICEVIGWLSDGLAVIEPELTALVTTADMALCHGDYRPPPAFTVHAFQTPPLQAPDLPAAA